MIESICHRWINRLILVLNFVSEWLLRTLAKPTFIDLRVHQRLESDMYIYICIYIPRYIHTYMYFHNMYALHKTNTWNKQNWRDNRDALFHVHVFKSGATSSRTWLRHQISSPAEWEFRRDVINIIIIQGWKKIQVGIVPAHQTFSNLRFWWKVFFSG